jgi:hypothetical protein
VAARITDVERVKKAVRRKTAGRVLAGDAAEVSLDLACLQGCRVSVAGGYGSLSQEPQRLHQERMIWILDGRAEIHSADGKVTFISQGESTVLRGGASYRLDFPQLTIYLAVDSEASD